MPFGKKLKFIELMATPGNPPQKYVDPLRQMIATMKDQDKQNLNKLNKLYEILTNPERKIPMNSLIKSEEVLEKLLNNKQGPGSGMVIV